MTTHSSASTFGLQPPIELSVPSHQGVQDAVSFRAVGVWWVPISIGRLHENSVLQLSQSSTTLPQLSTTTTLPQLVLDKNDRRR